MADDGVIRIGTEVDISGLQAGMAEAAEAVDSAASSMRASATAATSLSDAQQRAQQTAKLLADAQAQLGASASRGNAQAKAILEDYQAQATSAATAVAELTGVVEADTVALNEQSLALRSSSAGMASLGLSSRQSASAGIGILEGRMMSGNRAAAAFLSTTLGLGPVLQAAFPVIGALALAEVLVEIGKSAYEAYEKFVSLDEVTEKLTADIKKMQQQDFVNVHSIETAKDRLDQATVSATNLREVAQNLHDISLKGLFGDIAQGNLGGLATDISGILNARSAAGESSQKTLQSIALTKTAVEEEHQLRLAKIESAHAGDEALLPEQKITAELQKQLALHAEAQRYSREQDRAMGNPVAPDEGNQLRQAQDQGAYAEAAAQKIIQLRDYQRQAISEMLNDDRTAMQAMEKENNDLAENMMNTWREGEEAATKSLEEQRRAQEAATADFKKNHEAQINIAKLETEDTIKAANDKFEAISREIKMEEELGRISARTAAQQLLAAEQLKEATTQSALGKEQQLFNPAYGNQELQEYLQLQNKMDEAARQGSLTREQIVDQETTKIESQYKKAADMFNKDFVQAFNGIISGTKTAAQAFSQMFQQIITQLSDFVIEWLLKKAELWIMDELLGVQSASKQHAQQAALNVATVTGDAAVAAAGALAYYSAFDPPIAPAMAAAQFGLTMAYAGLAAFDSGTNYVPHDGVAMIHRGEAVLPATTADEFRTAMGGGGTKSSGPNVNLHYNPQVSAYDRSGMSSTLKAHKDDILDIVRRGYRGGAFA